MASADGASTKSIARLMVRRHLRSWTGSPVVSEEILIGLFQRAADANPDLTMQQVAAVVEAEIRDLLSRVMDL